MTHVLFLCTGNSARSIMAESYLNARGKANGFVAFSAGSTPTGAPNPFALQTLDIEQIGVHTGDGTPAASKSWNLFGAPEGVPMDLVITVCDNAAGEVCPIWPARPGHDAPETRHWSFPDPAAATGSDDEKRAAFKRIFSDIRTRIDELIAESST